MTLQTIPGAGLWVPELPDITLAAQSFNSLLMDAGTEKVAFCGHMFNKDRATKSVTKVGFLPGTVTLNSASTIKVSLQGLSQTAGTTTPSGTILGATNNGFITEAAATYATNTWHQTAALGETVSLTYGQEVAIVIEYGTFTAADVFNVRGLALQQAPNFPVSLLYTGSWAGGATLPNVILEFDDGTFGTLEGAFPISATYNTGNHHSASTPDEYALEFQLPFPCKVDAFTLNMAIVSATADFKVILYEGTTAMSGGTATFDGAVIGTNVQRMLRGTFTAQVSLTANTTYRLALQPQSASQGVTLYGFDVANANHFQAHGLGTTGVLASRTDAGAWSNTTTRRPFIFFRVSACGDDTGGGGGLAMPVSGRICA